MFLALRFIIGAMLTILVFYIKKRVSGKADLRIIVIVVAVIISLLSFFPFENLFLTFDSPEEPYKYVNAASPDIKWVVEGTDSDLVIGDKDGTDVPFIVPKTEKGWKLGTGINTIPIVDKSISTCFVSVYHAIGTEDYYLIIFNLLPGSVDIADSIDSEFLVFEEYDPENGETYTTYYAVLPSNDEQYRLCINGEEYSIFQGLYVPCFQFACNMKSYEANWK